MTSYAELSQLMQTGGAETFRAADIGYKQHQIDQQKLSLQQQALTEQQKEMKAEQGKPPELAQMAQNVLGTQYKLTDENGLPTDAGLLNQEMITLKTDLQQAQQLAKQEKYYRAMGDTKSADVAGMESRRYLTQSRQTGEKINQLKTKSYDDFYNNLYNAKNQQEYDERLQSSQERTGAPLPSDLPKTWTPEIKDKLKSKMSVASRTALDKEERANKTEELRDLQIKDLTRKMAAAERDDPIKFAILEAQLTRLQRLGRGGAEGEGGGGQLKITSPVDKQLTEAESSLKLSQDIESKLSNPEIAKSLNNTKLLRSLLETPKEMGSIDKYARTSVFEKLPKDAQTLVIELSNLRNAYYKQQSGLAVTGGEAARNFFAVVQPTDNVDTIITKLKVMKQKSADVLQGGVEDYKLPPERKKRYEKILDREKTDKQPKETKQTPAKTTGGASVSNW
jgi:hypothetical protein